MRHKAMTTQQLDFSVPVLLLEQPLLWCNRTNTNKGDIRSTLQGHSNNILGNPKVSAFLLTQVKDTVQRNFGESDPSSSLGILNDGDLSSITFKMHEPQVSLPVTLVLNNIT